MFPESQHAEAVFQTRPRLYWQPNSVVLGGAGFEVTKGPWRTTGAQHGERPGEATGEAAALVAVEGPGLKGSCRADEAWHREESL